MARSERDILEAAANKQRKTCPLMLDSLLVQREVQAGILLVSVYGLHNLPLAAN